MNKERDNNAHDGVERGPFGDDYLWNRSGPVDPQVEQLERLLSPYALRDTVQVPAAGVMATPRKRWLRAMALAAVLGCLMLGGYGWYWQRLQWPEGGGWERPSSMAWPATSAVSQPPPSGHCRRCQYQP